MRQQMEQEAKYMEQQSQQHRVDIEQQLQQHREEMQNLLKLLDFQTYGTGEDDSSTHHPQLSAAAVPPFAAFDSTSELRPDYRSRFFTFVVASAVPEQRKAHVFLTNQTAAVYKQLANLAAQQTPSKDINELTMVKIVDFMKEQFDSKLFIVRERFKFWSDMQRKPGETLQELAARIRKDAVTCDFPSIQDPQDEGLRQRFIIMLCQQRSCLKSSLQDQGLRTDFRPCCWSCHWDWRRGKGCQRNCLRFQGQASQQGPPEKEEGSTAEPSAVSFQRPAEMLPMWKGPQINGLLLQRSQVPFLWQKGTFESCLPEEATSRTGTFFPQPCGEDHKSWTCESNPRWSFSRYS